MLELMFAEINLARGSARGETCACLSALAVAAQPKTGSCCSQSVTWLERPNQLSGLMQQGR